MVDVLAMELRKTIAFIHALAGNLLTMTGMSAVAMSPKAGAHGELCGMMAIKAAIAARGEGATRNVVLVPESAHGTNPATAALIGFSVRAVPAGEDGIVSAAAVRAALGPELGAVPCTVRCASSCPDVAVRLH